MDDRTRRHVLEVLGKAHEQAYATLRPDLEQLPAGTRQAVLAAIDALRACLLLQLEGTLPSREAEDRIAALIHGHPEPHSVQALETYAHLLVDLLTASRKELAPSRRSRDH